ncbi:MAG TPA: hypothetical protein VFZ11_00405 [Gemmatimonadaceae bacterium]
MVARSPKRFTSEDWTGHWGSDARYWARRSDGACFAIDGAVAVFDLARSAPPASLSQRVASLPDAGRYAMRVVAAGPLSEAARAELTAARAGRPEHGREVRRLVVCGVRRAMRG